MTTQKQETVVTQLAPDRFKIAGAEYARNIHIVRPEVGTPIEALLDEKYWAHVSKGLKPWDQIEVQPDEQTYYALLLVRDAGHLYAKVSMLSHVKLDSVEVQEAMAGIGNYSIKFRGPHLKWCVLRGKDPVHEGLTKDDAIRTMQNLARATAA